MDAEDREELAGYLSFFTGGEDIEITKGYDVDVQFTVNGKENTTEISVIEIDGSWYLDPWGFF